MDDIANFLDEIDSWTIHTFYLEDHPIDCITFWTITNKIQIDWSFKRNKSLVYHETIRDSVPFYSKDINYLIQVSKFKQYCSNKFIDYKQNRMV